MIATRVEVDVDTLPYNDDVITFLTKKSNEGHPIYLVTASHEKIAQKLSESLNFSPEVKAPKVILISRVRLRQNISMMNLEKNTTILVTQKQIFMSGGMQIILTLLGIILPLLKETSLKLFQEKETQLNLSSSH